MAADTRERHVVDKTGKSRVARLHTVESMRAVVEALRPEDRLSRMSDAIDECGLRGMISDACGSPSRRSRLNIVRELRSACSLRPLREVDPESVNAFEAKLAKLATKGKSKPNTHAASPPPSPVRMGTRVDSPVESSSSAGMDSDEQGADEPSAEEVALGAIRVPSFVPSRESFLALIGVVLMIVAVAAAVYCAGAPAATISVASAAALARPSDAVSAYVQLGMGASQIMDDVAHGGPLRFCTIAAIIVLGMLAQMLCEAGAAQATL